MKRNAVEYTHTHTHIHTHIRLHKRDVSCVWQLRQLCSHVKYLAQIRLQLNPGAWHCFGSTPTTITDADNHNDADEYDDDDDVETD